MIYYAASRLTASLSILALCTASAVMLTGCPEPECEGANCGSPQPIPARDLGPTVIPDQGNNPDPADSGADMDPTPRPDMPIVVFPGDMDNTDGDMDGTPTGMLLSQMIIDDAFGSPDTMPQLAVVGADSIFAMVEREPGSQDQRIELFEFTGGMWQAGVPFADAMGRNASELLSADPHGTEERGIIYKSVAEQSYYYAEYNGAQWDGAELPGIFAGSSDVSVEALAINPEGKAGVVAIRRAASQADSLVTFEREGSSWQEVYTLPTRSEEWSIDDADVAIDRDGKLQAIFLESKVDSTFTGGKDSQVTYVDPDDQSAIDIAKGGAYEHRPRILPSVNGRLHVFYRRSDNLLAIPINVDPYDLYTRVREPGSKVWSAPMELRRKMLYYDVLTAPDDSLLLVGIDTSGDFFIRRYRNRAWNNLSTIKTDFPAIVRTDVSQHMDAVIDESGTLHVIYRTDLAQLAYFSYKL